MNVLILGSGGREHALALSVKNSPNCDKVFIAPGNAGTTEIGENLPVSPADFSEVKKAVKEFDISLVIVGPEDPLVSGICDYFRGDPDLADVPILGPSKEAAMLEGSKEYAKDFMKRHGIPTADFAAFETNEYEEARNYLNERGAPIVIKADGLAAGKGVRVCMSIEEAQESLKDILLDRQYGDAGARVLIEDFLTGIEMSVFALCDGKNYVLLPTAKDYKRVGEGDTGLNTGGMGAVSPVPFADASLMEKVINQVVEPTISGIVKDQLDYRGFVYFGLMISDGEPYVIEYNCRMGDPETEVVLPRVDTDLLPVFNSCAKADLKLDNLSHKEESAATVILVSGGYPGSYEKGKVIELVEADSNQLIFHAGTKMVGSKIVTNGGRVLALTSFGSNLKEALSRSYELADKINFEGKALRRDIGFDLNL